MKILILCDMFPPAFGPRMGYLCKYMKRAGWEPVVVTERIDDNTFSFLKGETSVTYVNFFRSKRKILHKLEWICVFILDFFFHYKDKKMAKVASRLLEKGTYAGILCSSYRAFPLPAARYVAEKHHLPLVIDLRDIIEQYASNEYIAHNFHTFSWLDKKITAAFRHKLLRDRNNALRKADMVTTISPWHVKKLKAYNPNTELVYNGYDPELFYPEQHRTAQFVITYTGRLISLATRDPFSRPSAGWTVKNSLIRTSFGSNGMSIPNQKRSSCRLQPLTRSPGIWIFSIIYPLPRFQVY